MAELDEIFDDVGESISEGTKNFTKWVKENPFVLAAAVVVIVAAFVAWRRNKSVETTSETATYYTYPTTGGSATFTTDAVGDSLYYDILSEVKDTEAVYGSQFAELNDVITSLSNQTKTLETQISENQNAAKYNQILAQMQANSDLYILSDDADLKKQLHAENLALADELGLTFNQNDGSYYDAVGNRAYLTQLQSYSRTTDNTKNSGSMVNNAEYNRLMNEAVSQGVQVDATLENAISKAASSPVTAESYGTAFDVTPGSSSTYSDGFGKSYQIASDGKPIEVSSKAAGTTSGKTTTKTPVMSRDTSRAGTTVKVGNYNVTYDENGYATSKVKVK